MINLYEYQAKKILAQYNLPITKGCICKNTQEIENYIVNNKGPWVAKCQVRSGGRGKSGGIYISHSIDSILSFSKKWFGNKLITSQTSDTGELVNRILIEPVIKVMQELYVSLLIDRDYAQVICVVSAQGGVDIEKISVENPDKIYKITIDPSIGAYPYQGRMLAYKLGLSTHQINKFSNIIINMSRMLLEKDLMLIEINPLIISDTDSFLCLDAKIIVDQNSIFRQSALMNMLCITKDQWNEITIPITQSNKTQLNINYIPLSTGNIGCMVNGAGLAMATMDLIKEAGGEPANFLDVGGEVNEEYIVLALQMLLNNIQIKAILINIFGGIVCCNLIANGIITVLSNYICKNTNHLPIIVRLQGNNSEIGIKKLINSKLNITVTNNLIHAIQQVVFMVK